MLSLAPLVLATVVASAPSRAPTGDLRASTYDEAACAELSEGAPPPEEVEADCSDEPAASPPALLDCNDSRMSLWVGEMIGSCDMPRASVFGATLVVPRVASPAGPPRLCEGVRCGYHGPPLRSGSRPSSDQPPALLAARSLRDPDHGETLSAASSRPQAFHAPDRLERPPRAPSVFASA